MDMLAFAVTIPLLLQLAFLGLMGAQAGGSIMGYYKDKKNLRRQMDLDTYVKGATETATRDMDRKKREALMQAQKELGTQTRKDRDWETANQILGVQLGAQDQRLQMLMGMVQQAGAIAGQQTQTSGGGALPMSMYLQR